MLSLEKSDFPEGLIVLATKEGRPEYGAYLSGRYAGWLMWRHPDGQWVTSRKLESWEIMQVEDQRDQNIIQEEGEI